MTPQMTWTVLLVAAYCLCLAKAMPFIKRRYQMNDFTFIALIACVPMIIAGISMVVLNPFGFMIFKPWSFDMAAINAMDPSAMDDNYIVRHVIGRGLMIFGIIATPVYLWRAHLHGRKQALAA